MVFDDFSSGMGSNIHIMGFLATVAWRRGSIVLWGARLGEPYTDPETCGDQKNWLCHLLPPSSCSLVHAQARQDTMYVNIQTVATLYEKFEGYPQYISDLMASARLDFKWDELKYWWRAQAR